MSDDDRVDACNGCMMHGCMDGLDLALAMAIVIGNWQ